MITSVPLLCLPAVLLRQLRLALLLILFWGVVLSPVSVSAGAPPVSLPPGFVQDLITDRLDAPTAFALAPDGRIFVTEKAGRVRVIQNGRLLESAFVDLSQQVNQIRDRGMMGVAVHPDWPQMPYIYLAYTYEPPQAQGYKEGGARVARVSRITADPGDLNRALPDSEFVILGKNSLFIHIGNPDTPNAAPFTCQNSDGGFVQDCIPLEATSHTVGQLLFGPDGALYVGSGDGIEYTPPNLRAQDVNSLSGKILRIDPMTGAGYRDNPFYNGDPEANRSKVYAVGMRNPWRFSFGPDGAIYVADVGNNSWETIGRGVSGANFGWPCYEGPDRVSDATICQPLFNGESQLTPDYHVYPHGTGKGAAIGGDFSPGHGFPTGYQGHYFFADYNSWAIYYLEQTGEGVKERLFATNAPGLVQMTFAPDGSLYVLYIVSGSLARIRYAGGVDQPPLVVMEATPRYGQPPLLVQFSSEGTLDPEGTALRYVWSFDDGETSDAADPSHTYTEAGNYKVLLTVTDGKDLATTATLNIGVGNEPPQAQILSPTGEARYRMGDTVEFQGRAMDAEDGVLTGAALQWEVFTHHNEHIHYDTFRGNGERGSFVYADHGDTVYLELCLIATDSADLQDRKCVDLYPQVITITFQSLPSGLPLLYDNTRYTTPFEVQTYINAVRSVEAPIAAGDLHFERWADSENAGRRITIPAEDLELTAIYMDVAGEGTTAEDKVPAAVVIANPDVEMSDDAQSVSAMPAELGIIHIAVAPSGGARILLETAGRFAGKWSAVQWQDATGTWQEIEGWQGQIENGRKRWWVAPDLYGNRFFRWVISDGEAGPVLAISKPFALPGSAEEMVVWQVE